MSDDVGRTANETLQDNIGTILNNFSSSDKQLIRKIESLSKKEINVRYAVIFNETCEKENLLPVYTNIKTYDRAVQRSRLTSNFRRDLLKQETVKKRQQLEELNKQLEEVNTSFDELDVPEELKERTCAKLGELIQTHEQTVRTRVLRKLSSLYGGPVCLPESRDSFLNLSSHALTQDQKDLLNLGLNCSYYPRSNRQEKKAEVELLYQQICDHHKAGRIDVNPDIQAQLLAEGTKLRGDSKSRIVTQRLRKAAEELRNNPGLIIRRADKSSIFVLLDRVDYLSKVSTVLRDTSKFQRLTRNPVEKQKKDLNRIIDAINAEQGGVKFTKLTGDYNPGYFYGNPKTHKNDIPIRPIISQIPTPAYDVAKQLNAVISPYIPKTYSLTSSDEFLEVLKARERKGILASLDASSLFTNVPVDETIDIILEDVYGNESIPAPRIPRAALKSLLQICAKDTPFRCPEGNLYRQVDGVAMGSPLGVLFAEAYMAHVESIALDKMATAPFTYCRYIDDIFVDIHSEQQLLCLKAQLEEASVLTFTVELAVNHKMSFLDVAVDALNGEYVTSVYRKPTDNGSCLNGLSETPDRYKESVIRSYVHRALKHCSSWPLIHQEFNRIRSLLASNNYTLTLIDAQIRRQLHQHFHSSPKKQETDSTTIPLYYQNKMSSGYKSDEKAIRNIVNQNCIPTNPNHHIKLIIYCKTPKVAQLIMKNNLSGEKSLLKMTNIVYEFKCPIGDCAHRPNNSYIGHTTTTLSRRMTMHLQDGAPRRHMRSAHGRTLTRTHLVDNTTVLARCGHKARLKVLEAVHIRDKDPTINRQMNMRGTLWLCDGQPLAPRM